MIVVLKFKSIYFNDILRYLADNEEKKTEKLEVIIHLLDIC